MPTGNSKLKGLRHPNGTNSHTMGPMVPSRPGMGSSPGQGSMDDFTSFYLESYGSCLEQNNSSSWWFVINLIRDILAFSISRSLGLRLAGILSQPLGLGTLATNLVTIALILLHDKLAGNCLRDSAVFSARLFWDA